MLSQAATTIGSQFQIDPRLTYLNHAGIGPPGRLAVLRAQEVIALQGERGSLGSPTWQGYQASARRRAASLIGCSDHEIAFTKNTPESISVVASGLRWRHGESVVVPRCEFPANVYPWMNLAARGVEIRWIEAPDGVFSIEDVAHAIDRSTRIVALSWIQFASGYRIDLEEVGDLCARRGVLLLVDAIQGIGVAPIDVRRANIHFLATASHKWLLAPMGAGWLYCRQDVLDELDLTEVGQNSVVPAASYVDYRFEPKPDARRFEAGVPPYASIAGLDGALETLENIGIDQVQRHVRGLCDHLIDGLRERDCQLVTPAEPERRAGIVSFRHPRRSPEEIERAMTDADIIVVNRESAIRVAPHITNDLDDIEHFLEAL